MGKVDDMRKQRELLFAQRESAIRAREAAEDKPSSGPVKEPAGAAIHEAPDRAAVDEAPAEATTKLGKKLKPSAKVARPSKIAPRAKSEAAEPAKPDDPDDNSDASKPFAGKARKGGKADEVGTCSVCRKSKPLRNGLVLSHQKGLGKACAGSRNPPI